MDVDSNGCGLLFVREKMVNIGWAQHGWVKDGWAQNSLVQNVWKQDRYEGLKISNMAGVFFLMNEKLKAFGFGGFHSKGRDQLKRWDRLKWITSWGICFFSTGLLAQNNGQSALESNRIKQADQVEYNGKGSTPNPQERPFDLEACLTYAMAHQPLVKQSAIDQEITQEQIKSRLSEWYPRIGFNYNLQHNFQVQTNIIGGNPVRLGVSNTSALQFSLAQPLFTRELLLATRTKNTVEQNANQLYQKARIDVKVEVAKAYYSLQSTIQQLRVAEENIVRINRSLQDAKSQFELGVADKIDFKRATILLNNAVAAKKSLEATLVANRAQLAAVMGYPDQAPLVLVADTLQLENKALLDTTNYPSFQNRIEFSLMQTQRKLLEADVQYQRWGFLPNVSLNGGYNMNYLNDEFTRLYNQNYPASFAALTLSVPIFQGGKRKYDLKASSLQLERNEQEMKQLDLSFHQEYTRALSVYKSTLASWAAVRENLDLAKEVYDVVQLQYRSGVKTYLEVITAETDLRTAQINYYNLLYQLLIDKTEVDRAAGRILPQ